MCCIADFLWRFTVCLAFEIFISFALGGSLIGWSIETRPKNRFLLAGWECRLGHHGLEDGTEIVLRSGLNRRPLNVLEILGCGGTNDIER